MIDRVLATLFGLAILGLGGCAKNDQATADAGNTRIRRPESSVMEPARPDPEPDPNVSRTRRAIMGSDRIIEPVTEEEKEAERQVPAQEPEGEETPAGDAETGDSSDSRQDPAGESGNEPAAGDAPAASDQAAEAVAGDAGSGDATGDEPVKVLLAEGTLQLTAPAGWVQVEPAVNMIEAEFAIPGATEEDPKGRSTIMGAGGSVEANIQRWIGQFTQPDGSDSGDVAKTESKEVAGCPVHLVDIAGTYLDGMGGPVAPQVEKPGYRMLAAIIETPDQGSYFVKFYGPETLVAAHAEAFQAMIEGLKIVE